MPIYGEAPIHRIQKYIICMVGKSQIKFIKSLHQKKYRNLHNQFIVEGIKSIVELIKADFKVVKIYTSDDCFLEHNLFSATLISEIDLKKMSALKTPNKILAIFYKPEAKKLHANDWVVALDNVRDPGNLGTIIRLCDWFGVRHLVCSNETVDCYNPKTLQATMGSISRVNVVYENLTEYINNAKVPIYGAFMDGNIVYGEALPKSGILVMGNEANGISPEIEVLITKKICIPQFGNPNTESLNVATATAILLNEIRR